MEEDSATRQHETEFDAEEPLLLGKPTKGGIRTLPFIIANESIEQLANRGLAPNMTRYLMDEYGMSAARTSSLLSLVLSAGFFTPVLGAFLADSCIGRFPMIGFGSIVCFLGMILLWLTAAIPGARPSCDGFSGSCRSPTIPQILLLSSSFVFKSIGAGGIGASSLAFGGDQLSKIKHGNSGILESYISWYYAGSLIGSMIGMTFLVYIQDKFGWNIGFGIPAGFMFLAMVSFFIASPFYIKIKPNSSALTGLFQVIVASFKKRNVGFLSDEDSDSIDVYHRKSGSNLLKPTHQLRFLNKACIITNPDELVHPDSWSLCTIDQVEDLKTIIKLIPIWSTGIIFSVAFNTGSIGYLQVATMNRHITSNFEIPTGSFSMFVFVFLLLWIVLYDRVLVPLATKIRGKPTRLKPKQKIGFGIVSSCLALAFTAIVESKRREIAIEEGFSDDPHGVVNMSAFWLLPNYLFTGIADASCIIGQNELFYSLLPKSMSSIATTIAGLNMSIGGLLASFIVTTVDDLSSRGGNESWVSSNINKGHYDYYYWLLCFICFLSFLYYVVCCRIYNRSDGEDDDCNNE